MSLWVNPNTLGFGAKGFTAFGIGRGASVACVIWVIPGKGLGFRVQGLRFRVQGLRFRV